jgi:MYXO-CTERM domain-containing protein
MMMELLTDGSTTAWAEEYGLEFPVVEDADQEVVGGFVSGSFGIPFYVVLDRRLEMVAENIYHSEAFAAADELLETEIPDHSDEWPMPEDVDLAGLPDVDVEDGDAAEVEGTPFTSSGGSAPFGGASCSTSGSQTAGGAGLGLLGFLGLLGIRRKR